ncbi:hypothetical protein FDF69_15320 [Clostridium sporogenes]|nr:hypothetical protein [Clostridium sporogenes]
MYLIVLHIILAQHNNHVQDGILDVQQIIFNYFKKFFIVEYIEEKLHRALYTDKYEQLNNLKEENKF